ncbi:DNA-directed RNA polymerase III subunit RPC7 [Hemiscyllium ocellatum]|uniref:DNA-directed RNA polymerase III subunit RPC7 n=1 Tax=Hemiscyllium ocellatum TaxID=170820 RepID=UPI0029671269|nr:DNA-directed RNA polymerase III subunit RPC7 [Hemiscyllium ocellatum]
MSGSGRGRGRAQFTFNIEAIGFSRGETLPEAAYQPLPLFPPTEFKPVPLNTGEDVNYILALKQELRGACKKLPYYIDHVDTKKDVERYANKYQENDCKKDWIPDWRRLPRELKPRIKRIKKTNTAPMVSQPKKPQTVTNEEAIQKLEVLEKKDSEHKSDEETEEKEKDKDDEEDEVAEEEYDEEECEEENDYIASYFDNGDNYEASDDNMDEATY